MSLWHQKIVEKQASMRTRKIVARRLRRALQMRQRKAANSICAIARIHRKLKAQIERLVNQCRRARFVRKHFIIRIYKKRRLFLIHSLMAPLPNLTLLRKDPRIECVCGLCRVCKQRTKRHFLAAKRKGLAAAWKTWCLAHYVLAGSQRDRDIRTVYYSDIARRLYVAPSHWDRPRTSIYF